LAKLAGEEVAPASIGSPNATGKPEDEASPSQPQQGDRAHVGSSVAAISLTKGQAKSTQRKVLRSILETPALSKKLDGKLQENLVNAGKAGVKIAEVREGLKKVAAQGCTCAQEGTCGYCRIQVELHGVQEKRASVQKTADRVQEVLRKKALLSSPSA